MVWSKINIIRIPIQNRKEKFKETRRVFSLESGVDFIFSFLIIKRDMRTNSNDSNHKVIAIQGCWRSQNNWNTLKHFLNTRVKWRCLDNCCIIETPSCLVCWSCPGGYKSGHNKELKTGGDKTILLLRFISFSSNFHNWSVSVTSVSVRTLH